MLCLETRIRQNTSHLKIYISSNLPRTPPHPPNETGYGYTCHLNELSESLLKLHEFCIHCSDSTLDLKISTRVILHFPYGRIHVNLCSYCFPLSFLHSLSHCAPLLYAIALIVVAAGIGPDSIEFQLQCKLGHFQFLV